MVAPSTVVPEFNSMPFIVEEKLKSRLWWIVSDMNIFSIFLKAGNATFPFE